MDCVAPRRATTQIKGYRSTIQVAHITKIWSEPGYWGGVRHISTFPVENFVRKLFGKKPKKFKRWAPMFHGYHRPCLRIQLAGCDHAGYYYFDKNSELLAEEKRILDLMK